MTCDHERRLHHVIRLVVGGAVARGSLLWADDFLIFILLVVGNPFETGSKGVVGRVIHGRHREDHLIVRVVLA